MTTWLGWPIRGTSGHPETGECRYCHVGLQQAPSGIWCATVQQKDPWGAMLSGHCPARGHVLGFRQPHQPCPAQ